MNRRFQQVDVFASDPLAGNPLAVVLDAEGMTGQQMQEFARWAGLSETAFLLPPSSPGADYRVRIFTLARELPFAGHPTLGACHAWLSAGNTPRHPSLVVQQCGIGQVPVRRAEGHLAFAAPPLLRRGPAESGLVHRLAAGLGIDPDDVVDAQWIDNGPGWVALLLESADAVLRLSPSFPRGGRLDVGVVGPYPRGRECAVEVRAFFTDEFGEAREDPVTGSLNAGIGQWLLSDGRLDAPYVASQGACVGRRGRVWIDRDRSGQVWVGGTAATVVDGTVLL